eukprot:1682791-Alexandrium_andersonii.AAC.1
MAWKAASSSAVGERTRRGRRGHAGSPIARSHLDRSCGRHGCRRLRRLAGARRWHRRRLSMLHPPPRN